MKYIFVYVLRQLQYLSGLAIRLTKLTGKSPYLIHPKHLIKKSLWYIKYLQPNDVVLDMGFGSLQHSIDIYKKVRSIYAFDNLEQNIDLAYNRINVLNIKKIKIDLADAEKKLPYKNNQFSVVLCLDVLEHIKNEKIAMGEIRRVLKKNGKLFLSLPNSESSWKQLQRSVGLNYYSDPDHKREYTRSQVEKLMQKYSFRQVFVNPITYDTPLAGVIDLVGGFSLEFYKKLLQWKRTKIKYNPQETVGFEIYAIKE